MRWTRDQQGIVLVLMAAAEVLGAELLLAMSVVTVEEVSGLLFVVILLDLAFVQVMSQRAGRRGPLRPLNHAW